MQRVKSLDQTVETMGKKIHRDHTVIEKLTHEIAQLERLKFERSAISRALEYSLKRYSALSRYLNDGAVPIDNNRAENQIQPRPLDARAGPSQGHYAAENGQRRS